METNLINQINENNSPLNKFFCCLEDNNDNQFQMINIKVIDLESKEVFLNIKREVVPNEELIIKWEEFENLDINQFRTQTIELNSNILKSKQLKSKLKFKIGNENVKNLKIIEKFYFKKKLIKTIVGEFPFCISNSINNWEIYYNPPKFNDEEINFIINNPGCIESDSFYLINDKLIIQNKNFYNYYK